MSVSPDGPDPEPGVNVNFLTVEETILVFKLCVCPLIDGDGTLIAWTAGKANAGFGVLPGHLAVGRTLREAVDQAVNLVKEPWATPAAQQAHVEQVLLDGVGER